MSDYINFHNKNIFIKKFIRATIDSSSILPYKFFIYFWNSLLALIKNSVRIAQTDKNTFLVTDKKGILYHVVDGKKIVVTGTPEIILTRQGGLLDVAVDEKFEENKRIFITASTSSSESGSNTALYSANFLNNSLTNLKLLYKATPDSDE